MPSMTWYYTIPEIRSQLESYMYRLNRMRRNLRGAEQFALTARNQGSVVTPETDVLTTVSEMLQMVDADRTAFVSELNGVPLSFAPEASPLYLGDAVGFFVDYETTRGASSTRTSIEATSSVNPFAPFAAGDVVDILGSAEPGNNATATIIAVSSSGSDHYIILDGTLGADVASDPSIIVRLRVRYAFSPIWTRTVGDALYIARDALTAGGAGYGAIGAAFISTYDPFSIFEVGDIIAIMNAEDGSNNTQYTVASKSTPESTYSWLNLSENIPVDNAGDEQAVVYLVSRP